MFTILLVIDWPKGGHAREANVIEQGFYYGEAYVPKQNDKVSKKENPVLLSPTSCHGLGCLE